MTIGIDGSRAFDKHKTGTENYSFQLILNLAQIDQENQYIIYLRPGNTIDGKWPDNFKFQILNFNFLWTQLGLGLRTFIDPLNILFVPAHTLPLVRKPGLKTVMTVHDLGAQYLPAMHQLKQRLYLKFITNIQLKGATKLIAVSRATKDDLVKKLGINPENIEVVYEGINSKPFAAIKEDDVTEILDTFGLKKNKYFLFVGTIQPRKNLERIVRAFKGYVNITGSHQIKLVIAGSKGWLSDEIYTLPAKLGIEDKVIFTGRVNDSQLDGLYFGSTALVYPSLFEGFGLPILEAFDRRCPVITSNLSSMPEVAGGGALLVDPYKTEEILQTMVDLAQNDQLRDRLIEKGQEQLKKFSWEKCAKETLGVFSKILK